jgi:hypothetical protein
MINTSTTGSEREEVRACSEAICWASTAAVRIGELRLALGAGAGPDLMRYPHAQAVECLTRALSILRLLGPSVGAVPGSDVCADCRAADALLPGEAACEKCSDGGMLSDDEPCGCPAGDRFRAAPVGTGKAEVTG